MGSTATAERLIAIYLNDHLAGATAGVELARRVRGANSEDERFAGPLAELCREIEADRETLRSTMERLGVRADPIKTAGGWMAEKLGRLKLNGQISGYSPLSRLIEVEGLHLGVGGKLNLWRALEREVGGRLPDLDFGALARRAEAQRERLAELHAIAAAEALSGR